LFWLTQVACTAPRSRLTAIRLRAWLLPVSVADPSPAFWDAELLGDTDAAGVGVPDAAMAAVPAPPMTTAVAPAIAMVFHMMGSSVCCIGDLVLR
jgi:hypothetical protein